MVSPRPAPKKKPRKNLSIRQKLFCQNYLCTGNATEAYVQAGYAVSTRHVAGVEGAKLLKNPRIGAEVSKLAAAAEEKAIAEVGDLLALWSSVILFDAREISQIRRGACRHCHGKNHAYHWRIEDEFEQKHLDWEKISDTKRAKRAEPSDAGGYGYTRELIPHPDCPMCDGGGFVYVFFPDSRGYSQGAAIAFDGVSKTKHGIKINTLDRLAASEKLAKFHNMFRPHDANKSVDQLGEFIAELQQRGSKAPLKGEAQPAPIAKQT